MTSVFGKLLHDAVAAVYETNGVQVLVDGTWTAITASFLTENATIATPAGDVVGTADVLHIAESDWLAAGFTVAQWPVPTTRAELFRVNAAGYSAEDLQLHDGGRSYVLRKWSGA